MAWLFFGHHRAPLISCEPLSKLSNQLPWCACASLRRFCHHRWAVQRKRQFRLRQLKKTPGVRICQKHRSDNVILPAAPFNSRDWRARSRCICKQVPLVLASRWFFGQLLKRSHSHSQSLCWKARKFVELHGELKGRGKPFRQSVAKKKL